MRLQLLHQPSPAEVLRSIVEKQSHLDLASLSVQEMAIEVDVYDKDDPRRPRAMAVLLHTRFRLAQEYAQLAMDKAQFGIVGNSWYNTDKPRA